MNNHELAIRIVDALFDASFAFDGLIPVRLQVKLGRKEYGDTRTELDGGGWYRDSAVRRVEKVLGAHLRS